MRDLASKIAGIWQNQVQLDQAVKAIIASERSLDAQLSVLTRVTIMNVNKVRMAVGMDYVTVDEVNSVFNDWNEFVKRPDRHELMEHWAMGKPFEDLPPVPEVKEEEEVEVTGPPGTIIETDQHPEGATIFGGDYGESDNGDAEAEQGGSEGEEDSKVDEVSSVQDEDAPVDQEEAGSPDVPELPA